MPNKQLLQSAGDGTEVPSGYVGEFIPWPNTGTTSNITSTGNEVGNGTSRITLNPGWYLLSFAGDANQSDSTVRTAFETNIVSGSAQRNQIGPVFCYTLNDDVLIGNKCGFNGLSYIKINQISVVRVTCVTLAGGTLSNCRITAGGAIRLA